MLELEEQVLFPQGQEVADEGERQRAGWKVVPGVDIRKEDEYWDCGEQKGEAPEGERRDGLHDRHLWKAEDLNVFGV